MSDCGTSTIRRLVNWTAAPRSSIPLSAEGARAIQTLVATPLADAGEAGLTEIRAREALAIVRASYEHQGGFRLRTLSA